MSELTLLIDGQRFGGWTEVECVRGIEQAAGSFRVVYTDRWDGQPTPSPIQAGARVQVQLDGETVITGHVDRTVVEFDEGDHTLTVEGRDAAGDLVDASAVTGHGGQWLNAGLSQIAAELAKPFGIAVQAEADEGEKFDAFALQEGETVFEALDRMARMRALLLVSDGQGGLRLTRAGTDTAGALIEGQNILKGRAELDVKGRYSTYICRGQVQASDDLDAETAYQQRAEARDPSVARHRPLMILAEDQGYQKSVKARAEWECRRRAARGARVYITVQGWRDAAGRVWRPNALSPVRSPTLGIDSELLIVEVRQTLDGRGTFTELTLSQRGGYDPDPANAKKRYGKKAKPDKNAVFS
jgi:prophage tail gpP-like protein